MGDCGNDALKAANGTGTGLGLQACITKCSGAPEAWPGCSGYGLPDGLSKQQQTWNFSVAASTLQLADGNNQCLGLSPGGGDQIVQYNTFSKTKCGADSSTQWIPEAVSPQAPQPAGAPPMQLFKLQADQSLCLTASQDVVLPTPDPWCLENNNMWRSNTDVLQVWTRTMIEVESMATQGGISRPGAWSFPDCLELGVAGEGTFTWNEAKTVLALFAVTSSPLILGNDPRPGMMQQQLIDLLLNKDMLAVDQAYNEAAAFAGGRIWSGPASKELWAKPLADGTHSVAVVMFNRGGVAVGAIPEGGKPLPPHCNDKNSSLGPCVGCFISESNQSPCLDNVTASTGSQSMTLQFSQINRSWLGLTADELGEVSCDVYDIFATLGKGAPLGRFTSSWSAGKVPPHGSRFIRLEGCSSDEKLSIA